MPAESHKPDYPPFFLSFFRKESALHCLPATEESPVVNPVVNPTGVFHRVFHQGWGWTACTRSPLALPCPPGGRRRGGGRAWWGRWPRPWGAPTPPRAGSPALRPRGGRGAGGCSPPPACRGAPDGPGAEPPRLQRGRGERAGRWCPALIMYGPLRGPARECPRFGSRRAGPRPALNGLGRQLPRGRAGPLSGWAPLSWPGIPALISGAEWDSSGFFPSEALTAPPPPAIIHR